MCLKVSVNRVAYTTDHWLGSALVPTYSQRAARAAPTALGVASATAQLDRLVNHHHVTKCRFNYHESMELTPKLFVAKYPSMRFPTRVAPVTYYLSLKWEK